MFGTNESPSLCLDGLCASIFTEPADQPEVGVSCVLPKQTFSPRHMHSPTHVHGLLVSQRYVGAFQSLCGHVIPQIILLGFFIGLLLAPTVVHHLQQPQS